MRYRYYVSQALLQQRKTEAGSVTRVPATEIEELVLDGIRDYCRPIGEAEDPSDIVDRDLVGRHLDRVIIKPQALEVRLVPIFGSPDSTEQSSLNELATSPLLPVTITIPWSSPSFVALKGIVHTPSSIPQLKSESRDALLTAIVKAHGWIDDVRAGRVASFAEIAEREAQGERHIRTLATLAFVSPRIITAIVDGTAPADLTVSGLTKFLPHSWADQERNIGLSPEHSTAAP